MPVVVEVFNLTPDEEQLHSLTLKTMGNEEIIEEVPVIVELKTDSLTSQTIQDVGLESTSIYAGSDLVTRDGATEFETSTDAKRLFALDPIEDKNLAERNVKINNNRAVTGVVQGLGIAATFNGFFFITCSISEVVVLGGLVTIGTLGLGAVVVGTTVAYVAYLVEDPSTDVTDSTPVDEV